MYDLSVINELTENEIILLATLIQSVGVILAALLAAYWALRQLREQFRHKVTNVGWIDTQVKLFNFQTALAMYLLEMEELEYFLDNQNNKIINKGNKSKYRFETWEKMIESFDKLSVTHLEFLTSLDTHQIIFKKLLKMQDLFAIEFKKISTSSHTIFMEKVFPEIYKKNYFLTDDEIKELILDHKEIITNLITYLEDFRIELQNVTVGKILGQKLNRRKTEPGYLILTPYGFIKQRRSILNILLRKA